MRKLKRQRLREYTRNGKSSKYKQLVVAFKDKEKQAIEKFKLKLKNEVVEGKRGSIYPVLKRLGARPGQQDSNSFHLPGHDEFTSSQSAEAIANYFSSISQEYAPLSLSTLPPRVREHLLKHDTSTMPQLSIASVKSRIVKAKKPMSTVPGDLPKKIVKMCADELAVPAKIIYQKVINTGEYPVKWKTEHQIAIPKCDDPKDESELRNIAKTAFLSKVFESFLFEWILSYIKPYLDPDQCGVKGSSIVHYLIKFLNFVHQNLDSRKPQAVIATCIDLSKAFNRIDHSIVITDLFDMNTPSWLLKIIFSYLSGRTMQLTFKDARSEIKSLPGGTPQGALLGGLIFVVKFNGAFLRPSIPRITSLPSHQTLPSKSLKVKYMDDASVAVSVDLKSCLVNDTSSRPRPLSYDERTEHILPPDRNLLQWYIRDIEAYTDNNNMQINKKKTKVIKFTRARKWDFPLEIVFNDGSEMETMSETSLLGVIVSQDLKWNKNTSYICMKARRKLWVLRRLMQLHLTWVELFDVYKKEVRSILEFAVPVWHSSITKKQSSEIEAIQKLSFRIILGPAYKSYHNACAIFETHTLEQRRLEICKRFVTKNLKSEDHCLFTKTENNPTHLRQRNRPIVVEQKCNTVTFQRSSLPFLSNMANSICPNSKS